MADRYDIRPDAIGWTVCDRAGVTSIVDARPLVSGLRVEDADELAYDLSHDADAVSRPVAQPVDPDVLSEYVRSRPRRH